jgi:hypothetical protein
MSQLSNHSYRVHAHADLADTANAGAERHHASAPLDDAPTPPPTVFGDTWQAQLAIDDALLLRVVDASVTWPGYDEVFPKTVELRPTGIPITRLDLGESNTISLCRVERAVKMLANPPFSLCDSTSAQDITIQSSSALTMSSHQARDLVSPVASLTQPSS